MLRIVRNHNFSPYMYMQDSNPATAVGCRQGGQQGDTSRPVSATPYSTLERNSVADRSTEQQQPPVQQHQQLHQRTPPPPPPGVQWGRQKSAPSGDCFDRSSRPLLLFYNNKRGNDDSALPVTFA